MEQQLYIVVAGVLLGLVAIIVLPRNPQPKQKVEDDNANPQPSKPVEKLPEGVSQRDQVNSDAQALEEEITHTPSPTKTQLEQKAEVNLRKEKLLKSLNPQERKLIDDYFKQRAEEIFDGKAVPKEERRFRMVMKIINCGTYFVVIIAFLVLIILAFGTTNPVEIKRGFELIAIRLMGFLQGQLGNPNQFT